MNYSFTTYSSILPTFSAKYQPAPQLFLPEISSDFGYYFQINQLVPHIKPYPNLSILFFGLIHIMIWTWRSCMLNSVTHDLFDLQSSYNNPLRWSVFHDLQCMVLQRVLRMSLLRYLTIVRSCRKLLRFVRGLRSCSEQYNISSTLKPQSFVADGQECFDKRYAIYLNQSIF